MLVLSRRVGDGVLIGPDVRVVINGVHGNQVSLAISAAATLKILRTELLRTLADQFEWEDYCKRARAATETAATETTAEDAA
jgi:carbon storage regulator CsrA